MADDWTERLAGARMRVDQQYSDRVQDSRFTKQEWGLIMTAVDFQIRYPEDPDDAQLVADTDKIRDIVPELDSVQRQMGGSHRPVTESTSGGGLLGRVRQYLSFLDEPSSEGSDEERIAAATVLVEGYTEELQAFLESHGSWAEVCAAASEARETGNESGARDAESEP